MTIESSSVNVSGERGKRVNKFIDRKVDSFMSYTGFLSAWFLSWGGIFLAAACDPTTGDEKAFVVGMGCIAKGITFGITHLEASGKLSVVPFQSRQ